MEADKLTFKDLFARVPVGQLWAFVGVIAGLTGGAFGGAWWIRGTIEETKTQTVVSKNEALERELLSIANERTDDQEKTRQLHEKDRFLSLYLRYVMARDGVDASISEDSARKALDDCIEGHVDREKLIIHKGGGRLATVEFPDGTIWTLPRELHMVEAN